MANYEYSKDMREILGCGGAVEADCRSMVVAGLHWLDAHPGTQPEFSEQGILVIAKNDDAKALMSAIHSACPHHSGIMEYAAINDVLFVHQNDRDTYCQIMRRDE